MNFVGKIILNSYSIIILIIILYQLKSKDKQVSATYKIYIALIKITIIMLIIDITSRFDGNLSMIYIIINHVSNFLVFSFNLLIPSLWLLYVHYHIWPELGKNKKLQQVLTALNISNIIVVILSLKYKWLYYIDGSNIYHRGPYYIVSILVTILIVISAFILIYTNKNKIEKKHYFALQFFSVPPIIGMILQTLLFDIPLALNSLVVSMFLVFISIQKNTINTDYLTGVGNKSNFETELANKIHKVSKEKTFAGIMIDLYDFKSINDKLGHDIGDLALIAAADILVNNVRYNDVLSRVGGDEFCIILDITHRKQLDLIVTRILSSVELYNETSGMPYKLKLSIGYDIYDYDSRMSSDEFKKHIDKLMYKNKEKDKIEAEFTSC